MANPTLPPPAPPAAAARDGLLARIGDSPNLPTPPAVALEVIQKASQPDCEVEEIGRVIALDPGLCGSVLRAVNSAVFGLQRPIASIDRALSFLGLKAVRSLVLSLSLPTLRLQTSTDPRLRDYWRTSVAGAIVARELAVKLGRPDPEDDMAAALLCDLGVFVLQQVFPAEYAPVVAQPAEVRAYRQCELEEGALGLHHADVSAFILGRWRLPDDITTAVRHHHHPAQAPPGDRAAAERSRLLYLATRAAQLQGDPGLHPALLREVVTLACDQLRMSEERFLEFLEPLDRKIDEFVAILQMDVGALASYPTVVANAAVELVQLTLEAGAEAAEARAARLEADRELLRWRRLAHRLRREATRDRLTGAYNRPYLDEALAREFRRARRRCTVLDLLFLDLDNLKGLNDAHGHPFGDEALKEAAALRREARAGDVVARYGGDEFCVLMADTSPDGVETLANRVWHALNGLRVKHQGAAERVSASVGAAVCLPQRGPRTAAELLATADRALYAAKATGKNKVSLFSLLTDDDRAVLEEVRRRLFSTFLLGREVVSEQQVEAARRASPLAPLLPGRLARRLGWIAPRRLRRVLRDLRQERRPFGERALARRYLTRAQVCSLLALQREPPEDFAEGLIDACALTPEEARREVEAYYATIV
jgi:diguanylate cyclase (GGDEF)-like protein